MPGTELAAFITLTIAGLIGFVVLIRFSRGWLLHRTLRNAIERDSPTVPLLIERIEAMEAGSSLLGNGDRNGLVLVALGLALAGFALVAFGGRPDTMRILFGSALFPLLVGAALLLRRKLLNRELAAEAGQAIDRGA